VVNHINIDESFETRILQAPPMFHFWGGKPQDGGFSKPHFQLLDDCILALDRSAARVAFETGAGLSTLWLLNRGFEVKSFVDSQEVVDLIASFLLAYPEMKSRWIPELGYSETTLPSASLSENADRPSICLIDGGHGVQPVFVDFVYMNYALINRGILLVDDLQLGDPKLLDLILRNDKSFSVFGKAGKLGAYRKNSDNKLLTGGRSGAQKVIMQNIAEFIARDSAAMEA